MLLEFGKAGWFGKARQQPAKVLQIFDKIRTDGFLPAIAAVHAKLDQPITLGYSNVGVVLGWRRLCPRDACRLEWRARGSGKGAQKI